jgi:hypothetical protein
MAIISSRTANWRLFGGGGLIIGGLLWAVHAILVKAGVLVLGQWPFVVALIVVAAGLVFVAFGETGSNGAVGRWLLGKIALVVFAAGFVVVALNAAVELHVLVSQVAGVIIVVAGLASAYVIFRKAVAKGAARWFLFVPVAASILWVIGFFTPDTYPVWWVPLVLAVLLVATGVLYLLNNRKIG